MASQIAPIVVFVAAELAAVLDDPALQAPLVAMLPAILCLILR